VQLDVLKFTLQKHSPPPVILPNWLPSSGVQVVEETAATLSRCYTSHFKGEKY
jgi:hypothetical protein